MKVYNCDLCARKFLDRELVITFNPPESDINRGATEIHLCLDCIPEDMNITTS